MTTSSRRVRGSDTFNVLRLSLYAFHFPFPLSVSLLPLRQSLFHGNRCAYVTGSVHFNRVVPLRLATGVRLILRFASSTVKVRFPFCCSSHVFFTLLHVFARAGAIQIRPGLLPYFIRLFVSIPLATKRYTTLVSRPRRYL